MTEVSFAGVHKLSNLT